MSRRNGILDWFKWESKASREKHAKKYYGMMFPFGEEQKEWEVATLKELFPKYAKRIQEVHFALLTLREAMANAELDEDDDDYESIEEGIANWEDSNVVRELAKKGMTSELQAMAILENKAETLEDLPTVEAIKELVAKM